MNNYDYRKEISEAIEACDNALFHLNNSNQYLNSAGNWGILDILGGGTISTFAKHSKMSRAQSELQSAKYAVQNLQKELQDVQWVDSIRLDIGDFISFADFFFDGFVADLLVQSRIRETQRQIDSAVTKIQYIRNQLSSQL